jgi:prepilin-type N-terminal cleavage/methylation domain-containing protein
MTLNNIKKMKDEKGFTIVELLIVIVIIAILAAIVIVAYTGIQQRARDSSRQSDVTNIAKAITAYTTEGNAWPVTSAAAKTALVGYTTANLGTGITDKIGSDPTASSNTGYGYTVCPAGATAGNGTGAKITWWKEAATAGLQTVNTGTGC